MRRLAGAVLITAAGFMVFMEYARYNRCKVKMLYRVIGALEQIRRELGTRQTPFPEIFRQLAGNQTEVERFFTGLSEKEDIKLRDRWEEGVETSFGMLGEECREILRAVGTGLGMSMVEEQLRMFDAAIESLRERYAKESEQTESRIRLWQRLSPGIAAAVALLLL